MRAQLLVQDGAHEAAVLAHSRCVHVAQLLAEDLEGLEHALSGVERDVLLLLWLRLELFLLARPISLLARGWDEAGHVVEDNA